MNVTQQAHAAKEASFILAALNTQTKNQALQAMATALRVHAPKILQANALDLQAAQAEVTAGRMKPALYERLKLTPEKLETTVRGMEELFTLPDPVGTVLDETELDDGLVLQKIACPIGVLGIIFEARPDVVPQICALCVKSGNAALLKGGKETLHTNTLLMQTILDALATVPGYPAGAFALLTSREESAQMLEEDKYIDLIIPRGGNALLTYVKANTRIPVLGHADGVCHLYIARTADINMACQLAVDAKTQYPAACNALETLLIDENWPRENQQKLLQTLVQNGVTLYGNAQVAALAPVAGDVENWHTEYGEKKLSVKFVPSVQAAISHINVYGSHHTDAIVSADEQEAELFLNLVDSAGVYHNASTRFADGQRYGFGAEVGISTGKTHARGPVGLSGLTIYKYKLRGRGQKVADYVGPHARSFTHKKQGGNL